MSPQQKAAETVKSRRQMAAIVAEQDELRRELADLRQIFARMESLLIRMERLLDQLLAEQEPGQRAKNYSLHAPPPLRLVP
jgi:hypothetical protein